MNLGKYLVKEIISENYAKVYKCKIKGEKTYVAVKFFSEYNNSMVVEMEVLKALKNKYIISLYEILEDKFGIAIKWAPTDLRKVIDCGININVKKLIKQLITAVSYIHKMGYIHSDIKPSNILIDKHVKIIDFELAIYIGNVGKNGDNITPFEYTVQTKNYMAPEIINKLSYSSKIDIWSVGIIWLEMTQGNLFIDKPIEKFSKIVKKIKNKQIKKLLSIDPIMRPSSASLTKEYYTDCYKLQRMIKVPADYTDIDWIIGMCYEYNLSDNCCMGSIIAYCNNNYINDKFLRAVVVFTIFNEIYDSNILSIENVSDITGYDIFDINTCRLNLVKSKYKLFEPTPLHFGPVSNFTLFKIYYYIMFNISIPITPEQVYYKCSKKIKINRNLVKDTNLFYYFQNIIKK